MLQRRNDEIIAFADFTLRQQTTRKDKGASAKSTNPIKRWLINRPVSTLQRPRSENNISGMQAMNQHTEILFRRGCSVIWNTSWLIQIWYIGQTPSYIKLHSLRVCAVGSRRTAKVKAFLCSICSGRRQVVRAVRGKYGKLITSKIRSETNVNRNTYSSPFVLILFYVFKAGASVLLRKQYIYRGIIRSVSKAVSCTWFVQLYEGRFPGTLNLLNSSCYAWAV